MSPSRNAVMRRALPTVVGLLLIGVLIVLPDIGRPVLQDERDVVTAFRGRIVAIEEPSDDADPGGPPVPIAVVTALEGPRAGETFDAYLTGPGGSQTVAGYEAGDEVVITITQAPEGQEAFVAVSDRWRLPWLQALALVFAAAVLVVGRWHGARALVALGLTVAVILKVLLPLVISGFAPVPLAVLAATGVTVVTISLTEGLKRSSVAAILGTAASLAVTGLLGAGLTALMGFTYTSGSDLAFLSTQGGQGLDLRGVLLAAIILGAVGVLDDVTVTQAALVEELADKGGLRGRELTASAMGIGRSHIAATVNTLFLAYVGAGLPLLVVLLVSHQPTELVLNDETIATEIVRTLAGSLGILTAVPFTTFIAASLVGESSAAAPGWGPTSSRPKRGVMLAIATVAVLLVATAVLPALTTGQRAALVPDQFDPTASIPVVQPPPPEGSQSHSPASGDAAIVSPGDVVPIDIDGRPVGTVGITELRREEGESSTTSDRVSVVVEYTATGPFPLDRGSWEILLNDGSEVPLLPIDDRSAFDRHLSAGESTTLALEGSIPTDAMDVFVVYVDVPSSDFVFAVPLE